MRLRSLAFLMAALALLSPPGRTQSSETVTIYAAASLTVALGNLGDAFTRATGHRVKHAFAASSTLARQIEAGAEADLFISADDAWMSYLAERNLLEPASRRPLLGNRLVVVVPADRQKNLDVSSSAWLAHIPDGRIATGDPAHVPVGRYAEQALRKTGAWDAVAARLARADNVRAALVLVERGEAVAGIVYATDAAASKKVAVAGTFPEAAHEPIVYPVAMLRNRTGAASRAYLDFLTSAEARSIFERHGFFMR